MEQKTYLISIISIIIIGVLSGIVGYMIGEDQNNDDSAMDMNHQSPGAHSHQQIEITDDMDIPEISLTSSVDEKDGYNIKVELENFEFTPEQVNQENIDNQGHGHLYVNGKKITRLYSTWYHISSDLLDQERNTVRVTLNYNDHSELVYQGSIIADSIVLE